MPALHARQSRRTGPPTKLPPLYRAGEPHWVVAPCEGGVVRVVAQAGDMRITDRHAFIAFDLCRALNRHVDLDGTWVVRWIEPTDPGLNPDGTFRFAEPTILEACYLDRDDDCQFIQTNDDALNVLMIATTEFFLHQAEDAMAQWRDIEKAAEIAPHQKKRSERDGTSETLFF
ncbi:hypothetical protein F1188_11065 [Roseospira marina]|uniref:Uncharacterized protein n=1 Tax=Roseospira marina TaxID=140057 RepID=A0A5M6IAW5_9PROT|nr:hypothetical protein [Roseospira marina]KAA5605434.1 hypothetical protein F1188_11065 [Roseospira marina]MBB4314571.1 hypothetical protein [Roseospira marina]MBB5088867.1 hypothetical protein [Roseospira marina]